MEEIEHFFKRALAANHKEAFSSLRERLRLKGERIREMSGSLYTREEALAMVALVLQKSSLLERSSLL